jgi:hypothetical protein
VTDQRRACYLCVHYKTGWTKDVCKECVKDSSLPNWKPFPCNAAEFNPNAGPTVRRGDYYSHKEAIEEAKKA